MKDPFDVKKQLNDTQTKRKKLYDLLIGAMKREGYTQVPQLESSKNSMTEIVFK